MLSNSIIHTNDLYIFILDNDTLDHIKDTLTQHYGTRSIKKYDHIWQKGDLCIANYHKDKKWYRAKVLDILKNQSLLVNTNINNTSTLFFPHD